MILLNISDVYYNKEYLYEKSIVNSAIRQIVISQQTSAAWNTE
jgi:hypothetical protein